jgi:hypothetical protein
MESSLDEEHDAHAVRWTLDFSAGDFSSSRNSRAAL